MRHCAWDWRHEHPLLKGNLVIAQFTPTNISKCARTFGKMDLKSSKSRMRVLFTSIKCKFFQKVAFNTSRTLFLGWLFPNVTFGLKKLKQTGTKILHAFNVNTQKKKKSYICPHRVVVSLIINFLHASNFDQNSCVCFKITYLCLC